MNNTEKKRYNRNHYEMIGLYRIDDRVKGKIYIGKSKHYYSRISQHIRELGLDRHPIKELQESWNEDFSKISFSITHMFNTQKECDEAEIKEIQKHSADKLHNYLFVIREKINDENCAELLKFKNEFLKFIDNKWVVPEGYDGDIKKYHIWRKEDRQEIADLGLKYKFMNKCLNINVHRSHISFNKLINTLKDEYGYKIETGRDNYYGYGSRKRITYKILRK